MLMYMYFLFQSFKEAKVVSREGLKLVQDIAQDIKNMMELKISAVRVSNQISLVFYSLYFYGLYSLRLTMHSLVQGQ